MLNAHKLLFILPDVAYRAELLPTKKEHSFSVQAFHQINASFMKDDQFDAEKIKKLLSKIDPDEYHVILPDSLFTNTILEVDETTQAKVDKHFTDKVLPDLKISEDSHQISHKILIKHKDKSRVQLSAIENTVLGPLTAAAKEAGVTISGISPLSWSIKAVISLEPSISLIQMGSMLYVALQYIGVDQTTSAPVENIDDVVETIKTLKGAESSIQTVYLLTNQKVESDLKEQLSDTLPLQQLTSGDSEDDIPQHINQILETVMKTLDISDFPVPIFDIAKGDASGVAVSPQKDEAADAKEESDSDEHEVDDEEDEVVEETEEITKSEEPAGEEPEAEETEEEEMPEDKKKTTSEDEPTTAVAPATATVASSAATGGIAVLGDDEDLPKPNSPEAKADDSDANLDLESKPTNAEPTDSPKLDTSSDSKAQVQPATTVKPDIDLTGVDEGDENEDLKQFAPGGASDTMATPVTSPEKKKSVIKNEPGTNNMLKMIFITVTVLFITVAIGVGIGLGFLSYTNRSSGGETTPVVVASPEPDSQQQAEASPSPSPEAIDLSEYEALVVNATTIAGKAGDFADKLDEAGIGDTSSGNAKGDYEEEVIYVLMAEENEALISTLEEALGTELTFSDEVATEDPNSTYDFVIVIADPEA